MIIWFFCRIAKFMLVLNRQTWECPESTTDVFKMLFRQKNRLIKKSYLSVLFAFCFTNGTLCVRPLNWDFHFFLGKGKGIMIQFLISLSNVCIFLSWLGGIFLILWVILILNVVLSWVYCSCSIWRWDWNLFSLCIENG